MCIRDSDRAGTAVMGSGSPNMGELIKVSSDVALDECRIWMVNDPHGNEDQIRVIAHSSARNQATLAAQGVAMIERYYGNRDLDQIEIYLTRKEDGEPEYPTSQSALAYMRYDEDGVAASGIEHGRWVGEFVESPFDHFVLNEYGMLARSDGASLYRTSFLEEDLHDLVAQASTTFTGKCENENIL